MFEKYIMIKDTKIICGQNASSGSWYCKELPAENTQELNLLINEVNTILNKYNTVIKKENTSKTTKARM